MNNRDFVAPYVFQEFPKWVTLADGSQMLVNNADEEAVLTAEHADPAPNERDALLAEAKALGLNPHHKTGEDKLRAMIAEAKA
jgi:hypothetical protein